MTDFYTKTPAKIILAGEHSVVRGGRALVLPFFGRELEMGFQPLAGEELRVEFLCDVAREVELFFHGALEKALSRVGQKRQDLAGRLWVRSDIPTGAGLGSSASLCVAIGRLMVFKGWLPEADLFSYCRDLEHLFHGESSGVDIAVVLAGHPIQFQKDEGTMPLKLTWTPPLFLSFTGSRGATAECVAQVHRLRERRPDEGRSLDARMQECVRRFETALTSHDERSRMLTLVEAMNLGRSCFEGWNLTGNGVREHLEELSSHGALAVKPTGSGAGGYVLSLWQDEIPKELRSQLIPLESNT